MAEQPIYRAYTVLEREREIPFWLNIGVAFVHKDTKGLNVILQALPLDGKLVLRIYEEDPAKIEKGKKITPFVRQE
jgi:hypothetical protein